MYIYLISFTKLIHLAFLCEILELFFFFNDTKSAVIALVIPITIIKYF